MQFVSRDAGDRQLRRHGILLEAAQFFAAPTVRALAVGARTDLVVDVTDEERLGRGRLVPLNGHRTGPVVAFLHAAFGEPAVMRSLDRDNEYRFV